MVYLLKLSSINFLHFLEKYTVYVSYTATLAYIFVLLYILMFVVMLYSGLVVTEAYHCAYVHNLCPRLYMVLLIGRIASVCFSGTEDYTAGCCTVSGFSIGSLWVSYSCTDITVACSPGYG